MHCIITVSYRVIQRAGKEKKRHQNEAGTGEDEWSRTSRWYLASDIWKAAGEAGGKWLWETFERVLIVP